MPGFDPWLQDESAYGSLTQPEERYYPGPEPEDVEEDR